MTNNEEQVYPYYRSPSSIRSEAFSHRMRGLDEEEVRDYLELLADQVESGEKDRADVGAENDRLRDELHQVRGELQRVRGRVAELEADGERANDQAVALFSQAQLVAEEMVEEVTRTSRERMMKAREQEREILQEALQAAEATRRQAEAELHRALPATLSHSGGHGGGQGGGRGEGGSGGGAAAELEHVRSFARIAQTQMQSIMDALAAQVERLGHEAPSFDPPSLPHRSADSMSGHNGNHDNNGSSVASWRTWQVDVNRDRQDPWGNA